LSLKDTAQVGEIADTSELVVLVMNLEGRSVGLLAAQPVDVVDAVVAIDTITHRQKGISGSGIIGKDTTLLIDVYEIAEAVLGLKQPDSLPQEEQKTPPRNLPRKAAVTILLAEDSGFFRSQITKYLEADGYRVLAAEDGQAGLDLLRQHVDEVSLVVTDIEMPVMNGLELTRSIKADPALAHLPIIALTTLADEDDIAAGKAAGVTAYEVKLDKEKLLQTIRQNLLS
jgi:two-component system chemotaxis sensor kinase CheA